MFWVHAAGEGEAMSALTLVTGLLEVDEALSVLLTSETAASARLIQEHLPKRSMHQYLPYDQDIAIDNFLDHWHPDGAIWVESEFWPNLVTATRALDIPMLLINARISEDSFRGWRRAPDMIRDMLACFDLCIAQSLPDVGRLATLGAHNAACVGNLKAAAPPLPADERVLERLLRSIGGRPAWLAAGIDAGEETAVARAHIRLREDVPDLLTIVAPRDTGRGEAISESYRRQRLNVARRSGLEPIRTESEVYVADTIGDMGLFYRLARIVFIGGSLADYGGHNPWKRPASTAQSSAAHTWMTMTIWCANSSARAPCTRSRMPRPSGTRYSRCSAIVLPSRGAPRPVWPISRMGHGFSKAWSGRSCPTSGVRAWSGDGQRAWTRQSRLFRLVWSEIGSRWFLSVRKLTPRQGWKGWRSPQPMGM